MTSKLKPLMLGGLEVKVPIFQGGMGVMISRAPLAAAVADYGGAGTIASVGLGYGTDENEANFVRASREGLQKEIRNAKELTKGVVGVNILFALSNYEDLAKTAVEEKTDFIVSGAGLPLKLPEVAEGSDVKLIPIVSSPRAADIIIKTWKKRYNRLPDAIVVEGPLAGGHLGFKFQELEAVNEYKLEDIFQDVLKVVQGYIEQYKTPIPLIAAGGIFTGKDIAKFISMGASGVQVATRFVATHECTVTEEFKKLYLAAKEEDVGIIKSPVGMPGRVIKTKFTQRILEGERDAIRCNYRCLKTCDPKTVPYCIAKALFNAVSGNLDSAVVFAGSNVSKVDKVVSVKELMDELVQETEMSL
ncbi:MAG: nitronate monooxygenase [PVC group bacterium]|nr:nitronate monooxygenase [PVC group bacterium]